MKTKLTLISLYWKGVKLSIFAQLPVDPEGRPRLPLTDMVAYIWDYFWGVRPCQGDTIGVD